jgi:hypothetical protein
MKKIAVSAEIKIMLAYSARKKSANAMPEYSTWKPATIFRFAFGDVERRTIGFRDAKMKYTTNSGNSQTSFQASTAPCWCFDDVAEVQRAGGHDHADQREAHRDFIRDDLRGRRIAPRNAYFESTPSRRGSTPYTPTDVSART